MIPSRISPACSVTPMVTSIPFVFRCGSIIGMARDKVTITLDRSKAEVATSLVAAASTSDVIDLALDRLIRTERLRRDVAAYREVPATEAEMALSDLAGANLDDDTDWEALYADDAS